MITYERAKVEVGDVGENRKVSTGSGMVTAFLVGVAGLCLGFGGARQP